MILQQTEGGGVTLAQYIFSMNSLENYQGFFAEKSSVITRENHRHSRPKLLCSQVITVITISLLKVAIVSVI